MTDLNGEGDAPDTGELESEPVTTSAEDVIGLYAASLGRAPESLEAVGALATHPFEDLVSIFFNSPEFAENVLGALLAERRLRGALFDLPPGDALATWAAEQLPLTPVGATQVEGSGASWHRFYHALFNDAEFQARLVRAPEDLENVLGTLERFALIEGLVDFATVETIAGWIVDPGDPDRGLSVAFSVDGRRIGVASANIFRREIQDRFGGAGQGGFSFAIPAGLVEPGQHLRIEVSELVSGSPVDAVEIVAPTPPLTAHSAVLAELEQVRAALERIQQSVPALSATLGYGLESYADYREAFADWRTPSRGPASDAVVVTVVIQTEDVPPAWLEAAARSVLAQSWNWWTIILVGHGPMVEDLCARLNWKRDGACRVVSPDSNEVMAQAQIVVRLDGRGVLSSRALEYIVETFAADASTDAVYFDEDHLAPLAEDADVMSPHRRREKPIFKPGFDRDLLQEEPYVGDVAGFSGDALARLGSGLTDSRSPGELLLRLGAAAVIAHIPRALHSRQSVVPLDPAEWALKVQSYLDEAGLAARAVCEQDVLGAPAGVRVVPEQDLAGVTATVIVPTKDRLDLLRPCLDSLIASRPSNRVAFTIRVVDHESAEPEVIAYLDDLVASGEIVRQPYVGAFNWALINNLAAKQSDSDVLVFLNNDTAVVTPDWLDELCRQAIRPEVGVVGARLIYADGSIQHAGFVSRALPDGFVTPEGVGDPGGHGGYLGRSARLHRTAAVTGACMAMRAELFRSLGGFDAVTFPVDWNDVDLCLRARAEGLVVLYDPHVTLYHFESKTRGLNLDADRLAISGRSARLAWSRWGKRFAVDADYNAHFDPAARPFTRLRPPIL